MTLTDMIIISGAFILAGAMLCGAVYLGYRLIRYALIAKSRYTPEEQDMMRESYLREKGKLQARKEMR